MDIKEVEHYVNTVIPNIESELSNPNCTDRLAVYNLYVEVMRMIAYYDFETFNKYLELDEDARVPTRKFYHQRKNHIGEIFQSHE